MATKVTNERVQEIVEKILGEDDRVEVDMNDSAIAEISSAIMRTRVRLHLSMNDIATTIPKDGTTLIFSRVSASGNVSNSRPTPVSTASTLASKAKPKSMPRPKRHQHTYVAPKMSKDIISALVDDASHVLWFKGATGTGKTVLAHYVAQELGMELFQLNCHAGMGPESFFGENTVEVDETTGQNKIVFKEGAVVKAMQSGLDEDGNETGKPGLLFIDEAGAMPANIAIALNRLLESDDPCRTITLENDAGRTVRSHSKFRIILAANTAGRGATDMSEAAYTAQMDALDISLLSRITMTFKFGYDRKIEKHILMEKLEDDQAALKILKFRDAIRDNIRAGKLSTPFSTRNIVNIADAHRVYNDLSKAIYYTVFEQLLPEEAPVYNEIAVAKLGLNIFSNFVSPEIDYM